jgi:hypothetical protein
MLTQEALRLRFWWAIADHDHDAWAALAKTCASGLTKWLDDFRLNRDSWCRDLAERQLDLWARNPDVHKERVPLGSVHRPRLPEDERTFSFSVEGWRPDYTRAEHNARVMQQNGFLVTIPADDLDIDTAAGSGETWHDAETRIRRAFDAALEDHKHRVEARMHELRPPIKKHSSKLDLHLQWLVRYQVSGESYSSIVDEADKRNTVREAVEDTARRLGLTLRPHPAAHQGNYLPAPDFPWRRK